MDDCLILGPKELVLKQIEIFKGIYDCDDQGEMEEYVGCKVERDWDAPSLKFTQPVMLQSFQDEFPLPGGKVSDLPASRGDVLIRGQEGQNVGPDEQSLYRSGVGKMLHMMKWSRPEILNRVRELSRFASGATPEHMKALYRVMQYCRGSPTRGFTLQPTSKSSWVGNADYEFTVDGMSDSDYNTDPETRRSVSGICTFLEGAVVTAKSKMQKCVTLSVTEAEFVAAVECAQDMMFTMRVLESIGLKVKKPMVLKVDNKGAVDLANNWSAAGRTRHVATRICFLRELKEQGVLKVEWCPGEHQHADLFTKNLGNPDFKRHANVFVSD